MAMKKLFELVVVSGQLAGQAKKTAGDLRETFDKRRHLFGRTISTLQPIEDGAPAKVEVSGNIESTVLKELTWFGGVWGKYVDTAYGVCLGNMAARADVVLDDGTLLLTGAPATALMELGKRAEELQELVQQIPTLDPAKGFTLDQAESGRVFKARDVVTQPTRKVEDYQVVPGTLTDKHPAQVVKITRDVVVGTVTKQEWSSMITPAEKAEMLARCEELRRALKAALHRANTVEVVPGTVAAQMLAYIAAPITRA